MEKRGGYAPSSGQSHMAQIGMASMRSASEGRRIMLLSLAADGQTVEGTRLTFRARGKDRSSTIVGCVAGQSVVLRSVRGGVRADYAYEVHPHDEGASRVTLSADCQSTGVLWRAMWPLLRIAIRASDAKQLRLLRATLEDT